MAGVQLAAVADKKHRKAATDRCLCAANLSTASAKARELPTHACQATACTGDRNESCGGLGLMVAFAFECASR